MNPAILSRLPTHAQPKTVEIPAPTPFCSPRDVLARAFILDPEGTGHACFLLNRPAPSQELTMCALTPFWLFQLSEQSMQAQCDPELFASALLLRLAPPSSPLLPKEENRTDPTHGHDDREEEPEIKLRRPCLRLMQRVGGHP